MIEFKLPELGENIEQGDLVRLMIAPGATVSEGQAVMELETDKAVVEVPSSVSGTVKDIRVKEGDKIKVGQVIFTVDNGAGSSGTSTQPARQPPDGSSTAAAAAAGELVDAERDEGERLRRRQHKPPRFRLSPAPANSSSPNSVKTSRRATWCG